MVRNIFSILVVVISLTCGSLQSQQISKDLLIGTWASCIDDGLYVELHFTSWGDYAYHLDGELLDFNVGKYIICSEEIHIAIQEKNLVCEQENVNQMKVVFKSDDEFENDDQGKKLIFKRLSKKQLIDHTKGTIELEKEGYMEGFIKRRELLIVAIKFRI